MLFLMRVALEVLRVRLERLELRVEHLDGRTWRLRYLAGAGYGSLRSRIAGLDDPAEAGSRRRHLLTVAVALLAVVIGATGNLARRSGRVRAQLEALAGGGD
jgi:hypothetical protein